MQGARGGAGGGGRGEGVGVCAGVEQGPGEAAQVQAVEVVQPPLLAPASEQEHPVAHHTGGAATPGAGGAASGARVLVTVPPGQCEHVKRYQRRV